MLFPVVFVSWMLLNSGMEPFMWAAALYPFALLLLCVTVLRPARKAVEAHMNDGKLKRLLLRKIN